MRLEVSPTGNNERKKKVSNDDRVTILVDEPVYTSIGGSHSDLAGQGTLR